MRKYTQSFTDEVFTVTEWIPRIHPIYKLVDYDGEAVEGNFYEAELQKVKIAKDKAFQVEEVLGRA